MATQARPDMSSSAAGEAGAKIKKKRTLRKNLNIFVSRDGSSFLLPPPLGWPPLPPKKDDPRHLNSKSYSFVAKGKCQGTGGKGKRGAQETCQDPFFAFSAFSWDMHLAFLSMLFLDNSMRQCSDLEGSARPPSQACHWAL